jgi:hypothetical protein
MWEKSIKSIGGIGEGSVEMGQQVAGKSQIRIVSGGKRQGYRAGIEPIASELSCRPCISILFFHIYLEFTTGFFLKLCIHFSSPSCVPHAPIIQAPRFNNHNTSLHGEGFKL